MKELDFDELDRAVNSLMGGVATSAPIKQDEVKTLTIESTLTDATPPVFPVGSVDLPVETMPAPTPREAAVSVRTEERVTPLANRRAGRFMDVVHPSSDMKKVAPSQGASRQGVTLEPVTQFDAPDSVTVEEPAVEAAESPVFDDLPVAAFEEEAAATSDWPDPIDTGSESLSQSAQDDQPEPLNSPFLPDAKVEKRPLGGAAAPELMVADETMPSLEEEFAPSEPVEEAQLPASIDLPEELQGDLIAIEAGDTSTVPDATPARQPEPAIEEAEPIETSATSEQPAVALAAASPAASVVSSGPVSIPQQYREEPNSGDQTSGSIYDTASYHQPLEHPAHKKSGWLWVVWVLILLILGAGGGALAYLYLLQ